MLSFLLGRRMYDGASLSVDDLAHAMAIMGLAPRVPHMPRVSLVPRSEEEEGEEEEEEEEEKTTKAKTKTKTKPKTMMGAASEQPQSVRREGPRWVVGLLERYSETVGMFAAAAPLHFAHPPVIQKKRVTLHKPPLGEAAASFPGGIPGLRAAFRAANELDYTLYEAAVMAFEARAAATAATATATATGTTAGAAEVVGDRYDYLLKYRRKQSIARPFAPDAGFKEAWAAIAEVVKACDAAAEVALANSIHRSVHRNNNSEGQEGQEGQVGQAGRRDKAGRGGALVLAEAWARYGREHLRSLPPIQATPCIAGGTEEGADEGIEEGTEEETVEETEARAVLGKDLGAAARVDRIDTVREGTKAAAVGSADVDVVVVGAVDLVDVVVDPDDPLKAVEEIVKRLCARARCGAPLSS
jgi:hypothetical protein